jgi:pilus assembly protein CpaB
MSSASIVVQIIAPGAGGVVACRANVSGNKPLLEPVAHLQAADVLVAKSGRVRTAPPAGMPWQTWPAATASNTSIHRNDRLDATTRIAGSIARCPNVVRRGVAGSIWTQKRPKGLPL